MNEKGLSLIQILISLAVIGIVASLAVPGTRLWISNTQVRDGASSLGLALRMARAKALEIGTDTAVFFAGPLVQRDLDGDKNEENYIVFIDADADGTFNPGEKVIFVGRWSAGIHVSGLVEEPVAPDDNLVIFHPPIGRIDAARDFIFTKASGTTKSYHVYIHSRTGKVLVR